MDVELSGEQAVLSALTPGSVVCELDARGLDVGKYRVAIRSILPKDVKLVDIRPTHADIELLRFVDRLIPVEVSVEKGLPPGLYLDGVSIVPAEVSARGSEKDVSKITSARILVTLDDLKAGGKRSSPWRSRKTENSRMPSSLNPCR